MRLTITGRIFTLTLMSIVLLSFSGGCGYPLPENSDTASLPQTGMTVTKEPQITDIAQEPVSDLKGYVWKLALPWADNLLPERYKDERGDKLLSIYEEIESLYNVKIEIANAPDLYAILSQTVADVNCADIIGVELCDIVPLASNRLVYSMDEPALFAAGLNPDDKSRWLGDFSSLVKWDSKQWTLQIGSEYDIPGFGNFILYNHSIISKLGARNMLNIVKTGKWTTDMYLELARDAMDLNDDGSFVFKSRIKSETIAFISNGGKIVSEQNGLWKNETEKSVSYLAAGSLAKLLDWDMLINEDEVNGSSAFLQGRLAFYWANSRELLENIRLGSLFKVGIAPLPTDSGYELKSFLSDYRGYCVPVSNPELVKSITVFNALAKRLKGDYVSAYLQDSRLGESSRAMLETIISIKSFDPILFDRAMEERVNNIFSTKLKEEDYDLDNIMKELTKAIELITEEKNEELSVIQRK